VDSYALTVLAEDGGVPARTGSLAVVIRVSDVTEDHPRFDRTTYDVTVEENAPLLSPVMSVRATSGRRDANIRYFFDEQTTRRYGQVRRRLGYSAFSCRGGRMCVLKRIITPCTSF